ATNNQVLTFNSGSSKWVNQTPPSAPVASVFGRSGTITAQSGDYTAAQITNAADKSSGTTQTFTGNVSAPAVIASGLSGATAASRYVGATASGAPSSGTFAVGDFIVDQTAKVWVCTLSGSPGSWVQMTALPGGSASGDLSGSYPGPSVAKIKGVNLPSGAPSAGQVLMSSSATTTTWQSPSVAGLQASGDTTGATDTAAIQGLLTATPAGSIAQLGAGTFYTNRPLVIPAGVFLQGVIGATQAGDATNTDWATTIVPVSTGWQNTYISSPLPVFTATAQTSSTMNGTAASGFTGTFTVGGFLTAGFPPSGTVTVVTSSGTATMTYTGITTTTFTGCTVTSGSGNFQTNGTVSSTATTFGQGGVITLIDIPSLGGGGGSAPVTSRQGIVNIWIDMASGPAAVDAIFSWGKIYATTLSGIGMNVPQGNGVGAYQNSNFSTSTQPDGWKMRDIVIEKGRYYGFYGFFQDTTMINCHAQQNGQGTGAGIGADGFWITWSHNNLVLCRSDLNSGNGFTIMVKGGQNHSLGEYWAATTLTSCTTQRNKQNGLNVQNSGTGSSNGSLQQSPLVLSGCSFDGDGAAHAQGSGAGAGIYLTGRCVVILTGVDVHCYSLDQSGGCPNFALQVAPQGTGNYLPGAVIAKGGFWNSSTEILDIPSGDSPYMLSIDVAGYGVGAFLDQQQTSPYPYQTRTVKTLSSGNYTALLKDETIICTNTGGSTIALPAVAGVAQQNNLNTAGSPPVIAGTDVPPLGKRYTIIKADSSTNAVTVTPYTVSATTDSSMNGVSASGFTGTFTVNSTAGFFASGTVQVTTSTGTATMTYTGVTTSNTTSTFTGCTVTSGSGTFVTNNAVTQTDSSTINGTTYLSLPSQYSQATVVFDGTNWWTTDSSSASSSAVGLQPSGDTTGVTDTAVIQSALNTTPSGGYVQLGAGTFWTVNPILIPSGVGLRGTIGSVQSTGTNDYGSVIKAVTGWTNSYKGTPLPSSTINAVISLVDITSLGAANTAVTRCDIRDLELDLSHISGVDGISGWGAVSEVSIIRVAIFFGNHGSSTSRGVSLLQNSGFTSANTPDSWNLDTVAVNEPGGHGFYGYFTNSTLNNCTTQNTANNGDGFYILGGNNRLMNCQAIQMLNGFTIYAPALTNTSGNNVAAIGANDAVTLIGCGTRRNNRNGVNVINLSATGTAQVMPVYLNGCTFDGDGANAGSGGGGFAGIHASGEVTVIATGTSVLVGTQDVAGGCPQYAVSTATNGSAPGVPDLVQVSGGILNAATTVIGDGGPAALLQVSTNTAQYAGGPYQAVGVANLMPVWTTSSLDRVFDNYTQPTGCIAATMSRVSVTSSTLPGTSTFLTSGTIYLRAIGIPAGVTLSKVAFMSGTTAFTAGNMTDSWYILTDSSRKVLAVTADATNTILTTANTFYQLSFATSGQGGTTYRTTYSGLYYVGIMVAGNAGQTGMGNLSGATTLAAQVSNLTGLSTATPILCGTSSTGQSTPPAVTTTTLSSISAAGNTDFYAFLS
ncbi:MAG TPA: hypothetical protein VGS08_03460, partial [Candidatus Saccharimonadales bacterium]|nr:hypothetical protein [Candidatus Saccharimonadales bacterium]